MGKLAGEQQRFVAIRERPVGISTRPRVESRVIQATDAGVVPAVDRCIGAVALGVVLREPLVETKLRGLEIAAAVQGRPQRVMSFEKEDGISTLPGQAEESFREASRLAIESPIEAHVTQAPKGGEEPRAVVEPSAELSGGDVRGFFFARAVTVHRPEAGTESDANIEDFAERLRGSASAAPRPWA
jgi:hypothetical protein